MHYTIKRCERNEIKDFIEEWHYSHSINGLISNYCFKLLDGERIIGGIIYGEMAMAGQWKKYGSSKEEVIELRRLVLIDDTKRNAESFFIGRTLRWLKQNTNIKTVVSYADPEYGHSGVVYRASNFKCVGKSGNGRVIMFNGKKYHDKTIRTFYKGKLKPFAAKVKEALENGTAFYKETKGKNIYVYNLSPL